jgi:hypothetical protein
MDDRIRGLAGGLAVAAITAVTVSLSGQTATAPRQAPAPSSASPARPYSPPRTPDGKPDLQGTYDVSTITPFERPQGAAETIPEEQARQREQQVQARRERSNTSISNPNRSAPPIGGDGSTGAAGGVGGYNGFWLDSGDTVVTINGERRSSIVIDPPSGRVPRLARGRGAAVQLPTSDAAESSAPAGRGAYDNPEQRPLGERCLLGFGSTSGPPTLPNGFYNNTKQIVQTPGYVMILNEMVHDARVVRIGGTHLPPTIRNWMGDSIGRWEGDTLVVETTNFTGKTRYQGSTENLKVTERFSRLDDKTLLYRFTVEDPAAFSQPWTGEYTWRATDGLLYEYACHEGNYALGNILRGARLLEKEAEEQGTAAPAAPAGRGGGAAGRGGAATGRGGRGRAGR